jgi:prepilin-type N-terminal cleavage/methylation domain-containing protein
MKKMRTAKSVSSRKSSKGFGLIEVLVAMMVLTVALVGLLGAMTFAMAATHGSQQDLIAKQIATQAMESIFTARNTAQLQWLQIQNVNAGTVPDGIFLIGAQPINQAGADGIIGTADDAAAGALVLAGPDGIPGTADDVRLNTFTRTIAITPLAGTPGLRFITITITYQVPPLHVTRNYVMTGYISQYR